MGKYKFEKIGEEIIIENDRGERQRWTIETLRFAESSTALPDFTRDMAREALQYFGLLEEKPERKIIKSDTIATIQGVKIYQDLLTRVFFYLWRGIPLFGSLSDIEHRIKKDGK